MLHNSIHTQESHYMWHHYHSPLQVYFNLQVLWEQNVLSSNFPWNKHKCISTAIYFLYHFQFCIFKTVFVHLTLFYKNAIIEINSSSFLKLTAKFFIRIAIRNNLQLPLGSKSWWGLVFLTLTKMYPSQR